MKKFENNFFCVIFLNILVCRGARYPYPAMVKKAVCFQYAHRSPAKRIPAEGLRIKRSSSFIIADNVSNDRTEHIFFSSLLFSSLPFFSLRSFSRVSLHAYLKSASRSLRRASFLRLRSIITHPSRKNGFLRAFRCVSSEKTSKRNRNRRKTAGFRRKTQKQYRLKQGNALFQPVFSVIIRTFRFEGRVLRLC